MKFDPMDDTRMLANLLIAFFFLHIITNLKDNLKWYFWVFFNMPEFKFLLFQLWNHKKIKTIVKTTGLHIIFLSLTLKSHRSFSSKKSLGSS